MKRREFLSAGMAAAATLGVERAFAGSRIGIGVIGTGIRGQQIAELLNASAAFDVVAICDVLPFRLEEAKQKAPQSAAAYSDHQRLLADRRVDAVIIATHFSSHYPVVMDALDAGKHVYCEKTMIKGIPQTRAVVRAAMDRPRQIFQAGFQYRTSPLYLTAAKLIADGRIGQVAAIDCQWNRNGDWRRPLPDPGLERQVNWRMYREYSGGLAAELSAHQMDFCNLVDGGTIASMQGVGGIDYWKDGRETYDNINLIARYESGMTATFASQTTNSLDRYRIAVLGKQGSIILTNRRGWLIPEGTDAALPDGLDLVSGASVDTGSGRSYQAADSSAIREISASGEEPTANALEVFADSILEGEQPSSSVRTGARASVMVQMALDAMDHGKVLRWKSGYERWL